MKYDCGYMYERICKTDIWLGFEFMYYVTWRIDVFNLMKRISLKNFVLVLTVLQNANVKNVYQVVGKSWVASNVVF